MARILFVAKDNGCASVTEQVAVLARDDRHQVFTALEGLAMARFEALGIPIYEPPNYIGAVNFKAPSCPAEKYAVHNFSAAKLLDDIRPDIIVSGIGGPINMEQSVAEEASLRDIPLVLAEDFWANSVRFKGMNPAMVLTVDDYAKEVVSNAFPKARVHIVGNPGAKEVEVPAAVQAKMDELHHRFDMVCLFAAGGGDATAPELSLLMQCLARTRSNWCLIPRFHPKWVPQKVPGTEETYGEVWEKLLASLEGVQDRIIRDVVAPSADPVAVEADMVLSGYSTVMTTALQYRVPAVCLKTSVTVEALKESNPCLPEIPWVGLGLAPAVTEPVDLSKFALPSDEALKKIIPYDAALAYKHIRELL